MRNVSFLVVLGGCVQAHQNRAESCGQVPVAAATGDKPEVIEQDDQGAQAQSAEQYIQHPLGAVLLELGNWRGVATARRRRIIRSVGVSGVDVPTLWSYASARFLLLCHEFQCRTLTLSPSFEGKETYPWSATRNWFHEVARNRAG